MRTFLMLYSNDYEGDVDDGQYKPGKCVSAERRAFTMLSSVCWCWWKTFTGWSSSPTAHWVKYRMKKLIKRECKKLIGNPFIAQYVVCLEHKGDVSSFGQCCQK